VLCNRQLDYDLFIHVQQAGDLEQVRESIQRWARHPFFKSQNGCFNCAWTDQINQSLPLNNNQQTFNTMAMQERAFQNLVLFFLNDINSTGKQLLKNQAKQLAMLEAIKDNLYEPNVPAINELISRLQESYLKMSELSIKTLRALMQQEVILPNYVQ
jgi:hypothetical protein